MQLKALRYFLMVSATGSFLATARHFEVSASSVSRFIAALEKDLGRQLFYRSTRAVKLTEEGERFYVQAQEAIGMLDDAAAELTQGDIGIKGLVRINAPVALGRLHIAPLLSRLQSKFPELTVELTLTDALVDPVQEGADITVRVGRVVDSGLIGRVVSGHRFLLAASPEYLSNHPAIEKPQDLLQHSCLLYKGHQGAQRWYFKPVPQEPFKTLDVRGPVRSNNAEVLVAAALAGQGIVLFPSWLFNPESFKAGSLIKLLPEWELSASMEEMYVQLLSPENRLRSRKVREVSSFLLEQIGSPPYWENV
ncbi:LysR family transcriptional regulator [Pseudomonas sp. v388]|uniref:LysR family transcriptional regulator n=1 Tax=Pseudomonas sp. v388 TaxID=2479849 RepID=UPI000F7A6DA3|nr:LysR family transcriptional regulator [Pseudomonas sp. v388]RRV10521.1 LysR family transcriptional regulator [Pseudomonas sp. v388]